ncbi:CGNR zinc finger domain-containing protein [Actinomycetospora succinea]|uniref:CGNR zinc finger domain-containing protein n=1 Tax=Actinomycetospora succinea TaxID=663603 RepID=UPI001FB7C7EC|nr:CGNR zinc finger domain-containing protein [Actinomycetospora succinea]
MNRPPASAAELEERCRAAGLDVDRPAVDQDVLAVRAYLERWTAVVDEPDPPARADLLNTLLATSTAHPRLTDHAGTGWHIHYRDDDMTLAALLRSLVSVGTALHLTARGIHRLARCATGGCERVFADVSRTGRQRYCTPSCANRDAVRRHRAGARAAGA